MQRQVSNRTATVAMILNGWGFSHRRLYVVAQFFEHKPLEHLLGPGIRAKDLHEDCLGRTLDWLYEHDVTLVLNQNHLVEEEQRRACFIVGTNILEEYITII